MEVSSMTTALVTGAGRGIGLELCRLLQASGTAVIATCRRQSPALAGLGVEVIDGIDIASDSVGERLAEHVADRNIDLLINNAGILTVESLDDLDFQRMRAQFEINTLGPLRVTKALLPRLSRGAKVVIITSRMGSMGDNGSGGYYGYRISKAGVNAAGVSLARDLQARGITVLILHPGLVATAMTGGQGIPAAESASNLLARIQEYGIEATGSFHHANGEALPW
jgi:NAD(P)-dependent dehydrogenase (short-subunit alcohol dehydrogenase family)